MKGLEAAAGIYDHGGWAVAVCVRDGKIFDRRRIELVAADLPKLPHHCEGQRMKIDEAVVLVERVRESAAIYTRRALEGFPKEVGVIAIRKRQTLPETVAERITNYRASNVADWVMYRDVIAEAAAAKGWALYEYNPKTVLSEAACVLGIDDISTWMNDIRKALGPPWTGDHRIAAAAAIVAAGKG